MRGPGRPALGTRPTPPSRPQKLREVEQFFATYKLLEDKTVEIEGWADVDRAKALLVQRIGSGSRPRLNDRAGRAAIGVPPAIRPQHASRVAPLSEDAEVVAALVARVQARSPGTRAGARRTSGPSGGCAWMAPPDAALHRPRRTRSVPRCRRRRVRPPRWRAVRGRVTAGSFPNARRRALWVGATRGADELGALNVVVDEAVERAGYGRDRGRSGPT